MLLENIHDGRGRPLQQEGSAFSENSARGHFLPLVGVLLLGRWLGPQKALAASGGRDTKSLLISEELRKGITMTIAISSAQIEQ